MKIGIGIDTGGTYTDAVVYDFSTRTILCSSKALTTKGDLSVGIIEALDALDPEALQKAELVSLSTTLATNACVEDKGGRAKLIMASSYPEIVEQVGKHYGLPPVEEICFLGGVSSSDGTILEQPDWDAFLPSTEAWFQDAEAVAIAELYAMKTGGVLERKAKTLIESRYEIPVIGAHELYSDLNSIQRASSVLLNARLLPIVGDFLKAIHRALDQRGLHIPVVIVRSDGSIMSDRYTSVRPVETLLCGPAASVSAGLELCGEPDALIVDMGGTTTDIALLKDGAPVKVKNGVRIGKWRTHVKGVYIDTFALGGDSAVRHDINGAIRVDNARVKPLCAAATEWPIIVEKLHALFGGYLKHTRLLHEFFLPVKDISNSPHFTDREKRFCDALAKGPLSLLEASDVLDTDVYSFAVERLEREGVVMRAGLTPTDMMHIKGDFARFDPEASRLGAKFVGNCAGLSPDALADRVYDQIKETLYRNLIRVLLEDASTDFVQNGLGEHVERLIHESWRMACKGGEPFFRAAFQTKACLIGIGAPTHIFLPDVAKAMGAKCVIPAHASVANALGAVAGKMSATVEIEVSAAYNAAYAYTVYGKREKRDFNDPDEAVAFALEEATCEVCAEMERRGATGELNVKTRVEPHSVVTKAQAELLLGMTVSATAVGGFAL